MVPIWKNYDLAANNPMINQIYILDSIKVQVITQSDVFMAPGSHI
jgi:hypothetical protein